VHLAREREGVDDDGSDPETGNALEKIIRRGRRKCAMQFSQGQGREQAKRVEMTAMVRDDDKRAISAEILVTNDFEAVIST
jgi:hypothetical protein